MNGHKAMKIFVREKQSETNLNLPKRTFTLKKRNAADFGIRL